MRSHNKRTRRLELSRETVRSLSRVELAQVAGGSYLETNCNCKPVASGEFTCAASCTCPGVARTNNGWGC